MTSAIIMLVIGLIVLTIGGEVLVRGAVGLARRARVNPLLIGLVIVGFGTSMPELVTSVEAALIGSPAIAWGNIVGSNMANSLLILGIAALIAPIAITGRSIMRDPGVALGGTLALLAIVWLGLSHWLLGAVFLLALAGYIHGCYWQERHHTDPTYDDDAPTPKGTNGGWARPVLATLLGLAILIGGGRLLVTGAIDLAVIAGLSQTMIGLTVVAIGTSLPELVTSAIAAYRGQPGVAYGNILGSNIYNLLGIGGATMLIAPGPVPAQLLQYDIPLLALASLAIMLGVAVWHKVGRMAGGALLMGYFGYLAYLITTG